MIPHVIHYCWFGGKPLPKLAVDCIFGFCIIMEVFILIPMLR